MTRSAIVVDDSRTIRRVLARSLDALGFAVREAADGREALEVLSDQAPTHVALVDWNMPEMDGLSLIRAIRSGDGHEGMRILVVTTETEVHRMVEALEAGADEYLMKPFTPEALRDKLAILGLAESTPS